MSRPSVDIALQNGNLGIVPPSTSGTALLLVAAAAAPTAGYGTMFTIKSKAEAKTAFANASNAALLKAIVEGFFGEAPEGNTLYVVAMSNTTSLTQLCDAAVAEKALVPAKGAIRLVAVVNYPPNNYTPTIANGFDQDVHSAVTAMQTLANAWMVKKKPFRAFIAGNSCDGIPANALDYATTTNRNCFIVANKVSSDSGFATLLALGRAVAVNPQQNIGRILSGSLNINPAYPVVIGSANVDTITDTVLDGYYDKRYITIEPNKFSSGYVITDDTALTAPTDDYNNLAYGRVIDNMVRIADRVYYQQLKNDVELDEDGRIDIVEEKALENSIIDAIDTEMGTQLSSNTNGTAAVKCLVNPDTTAYAALYSANNVDSPNLNLAAGGKVHIFLTGRPKGCLRFLNIYIGYSL